LPQVTFLPQNKTINVPTGTELLEAARAAQVEISSPCGGNGTCGKCLVTIKPGKAVTQSSGLLSGESAYEGFVRACRIKIPDHDIVVDIPVQKGRKDGQFGTGFDDLQLIQQELLPQKSQYNPRTVKRFLEVPPPKPGDGLSDADRLTRLLQPECKKKEIIFPLTVMKRVADCIRQENGFVTVTVFNDGQRDLIIDIEPGNTADAHYGIAADIGTTTVTVQIIHLPTGAVIASESDYNGQIPCGLDVISRINYARTPERLEDLRKKVLGTVNSLISRAAENGNVNPQQIYNAVISANTIMTHLLLGLKPEYIRLEPYTPTVHELPYLRASDIEININPESMVYISPSVGSYVGGDITAGILCTGLPTSSSQAGEHIDSDRRINMLTSLFIDIGTNGEIVFGNNDFLMTCACSAGPAFEGGGISCGMRAASGAVEHVDIDPHTGMPSCRTIHNIKPEGICGSGMISLLANLFRYGFLDAAGKLDRSGKCPAVIPMGRTAKYILAHAGQTANGKELSVSELDIENIIRAKAAIFSACALMIHQAGMTFDDVAQIYIGGGFGRFLDIEKAITIGLLPDQPRAKFRYIGNSSLMGSYMILLSHEYRKKQISTAGKMTYLDLHTDPAYMDQYTAALFLPHTDTSLFKRIF